MQSSAAMVYDDDDAIQKYKSECGNSFAIKSKWQFSFEHMGCVRAAQETIVEVRTRTKNGIEEKFKTKKCGEKKRT